MKIHHWVLIETSIKSGNFQIHQATATLNLTPEIAYTILNKKCNMSSSCVQHVHADYIMLCFPHPQYINCIFFMPGGFMATMYMKLEKLPICMVETINIF